MCAYIYEIKYVHSNRSLIANLNLYSIDLEKKVENATSTKLLMFK